MRTSASVVAAFISLAVSSGCSGVRYSGPSIPELAGREGRCRVGAGRSNPLVTEWPAAEKANLEALMAGGAVAVEYTGCSMRVLTQCRLSGSYAWQRTTPASDTVEIEDEDQLYAKLPLGAVSLSGELKRTGKLTVYTSVAGQMRLQGATPADVPAWGECARATHVVGALAVGAFSLTGSGKTGAGGEVSVANYSGGVHRDRSAGIVRSAGDWQACTQGTDASPHPNCRSPIQAFLWPIPGRAAEDGPPGTVKVDLVSANPSARWDVYYDDVVICTTPCSRWLDPARPLLLRTRDNRFMRPPERIFVPDLEAAAGSGGVQVQAHATSEGELVTGITFTTFGGMALFTGIALSAAGCGDATRQGMCTGGLTSLAAGLAVTAGSVWMIVDSLPRAEIRPGGAAGRPVTVAVGPGFVTGTF